MSTSEETRRILDMIESGKISASEGARLLEITSPAHAAGTMTCPYCAESIPSSSDLCPECGSILQQRACTSKGSGFHSLSGLGKFLVVYILIVAGVELANPLYHGINLGPWLFSPPGILGLLLSALGVISGILMLNGKSAGWGLAMLWSALQIVTVIVHGQIINRQIFHLGTNFHANGQGLGINLVGVVLLILFIKAKPANNLKGAP